MVGLSSEGKLVSRGCPAVGGTVWSQGGLRGWQSWARPIFFYKMEMRHFSLDDIAVIQLTGIWHLVVRFMALCEKAGFEPGWESHVAHPCYSGHGSKPFHLRAQKVMEPRRELRGGKPCVHAWECFPYGMWTTVTTKSCAALLAQTNPEAPTACHFIHSHCLPPWGLPLPWSSGPFLGCSSPNDVPDVVI